jgi:uncharacterized cupin superfamily protein
MSSPEFPIATIATEVAPRAKPSIYPEPYSSRAGDDVVYLEIGDRSPGEEAVFPDDDVVMVTVDGKHRWAHKDGKPY